MFRWDCYVVKQTAQCTNLYCRPLLTRKGKRKKGFKRLVDYGWPDNKEKDDFYNIEALYELRWMDVFVVCVRVWSAFSRKIVVVCKGAKPLVVLTSAGELEIPN